MNNKEPQLKVRFDGKSVGPGRISMEHLLSFLSEFDRVLKRIARVMSGVDTSIKPGPLPKKIAEEIALELVLLTHGSPSAVLGFDMSYKQKGLFGKPLGERVLESAISGLDIAQKPDECLPAECDTGTLMAWRDAGLLFDKGIERMVLSLNHRQELLETSYTPEGFQQIRTRIKQHEQKTQTKSNVKEVEGRLLMADFKEYGTRCRIHPSAGEPIVCLFDEAQKEEVLENILHYVRIVGEADKSVLTGKINYIKIHDIEPLEEREDEDMELLPQGTPIMQSFWDSPSMEELIESQNVKPVSDVAKIFGTWPGDIDDGFEGLIEHVRHKDGV